MGIQLHVSETTKLKKGVGSVKNINSINKPQGGLWTSTLVGESSDWLDWSLEEGLYQEKKLKLWSMSINPKARILVIDSQEDYQRVLAKYKILVGNSVFKGVQSFLNFEKIAEDYQGLRLTKNGVIENRFELYGWDVESSVFFDWVFDDVRLIKEIQVERKLLEIPF